MILVDRQIISYVESGHIGIDPFDTKRVQSNSYDLLLSDSFLYQPISGDKEYIVDPRSMESINEVFVPLQYDKYILTPGEFILGATMEKITLPSDVVACVEGVSSIARLGIEIHLTGGWIDAGFSGTITLEIVNNNRYMVRLYAGMRICQIVFFQTEHARFPYNLRRSSKYMNQELATLSRYWGSLEE
jgi:dCTP deaminase